MKFQIGFRAEEADTLIREHVAPNKWFTSIPVKSLVEVRFPARNMTLSYYNDIALNTVSIALSLFTIAYILLNRTDTCEK